MQGEVIQEDSQAGIALRDLNLKLERIDRRMAGNYVCQVTFASGVAKTNELSIKVQCKSKQSTLLYPIYAALSVCGALRRVTVGISTGWQRRMRRFSGSHLVSVKRH